jgi:PAS domain S-box-containing protein
MAPIFGATPGGSESPVATRGAIEEALRASKARNAAILESTNECIVAADHAGRIIEFNPAAEQVFGWRRGELLGRELAETIIPVEIREQHRRGLERFLVTGDGPALGRRIETTGLRSDGSEFPLELAITATEVDGRPIFVASIRDITERRRAEEEVRRLQLELERRVVERTHELEEAKSALERENAERRLAETRSLESQRELRDYIDHMATLSAKLALDGTFVLVNRVAQLGSGLAMDELLRTNFFDGPWWPSDEVRTRVRAAFRRAVRGESVTYDEELFVFGRSIAIDFGLTPIQDDRGEVLSIVAEARDITALKRAEERLRERTAELEATNKELEAFSYSVSHDLRSPLRAIDGFARILREDFGPSLPREVVGLLDRVRGGTVRMAQLIDDLLTLSHLGTRALERRSIALGPLVEEILSELVDPREDRRIELTLDPLPEAEADPRMLRQLLVNLIANALKFTRTRDVARIHVGRREPKRSGGEAAYYVSDNGVGFDMQYADRLFGVFQRLHRAEDYEGTGVGLAIAQRIVYRHGGRIWAEAEPDRGASFFFTLGPGGNP